jgi:uncharacterized protein YjiS (DUF1127 family)
MRTNVFLGTVEAIGQTQPRSSLLMPRQLPGKLATILSSWFMAGARWYRIRRAIYQVAQHDDRMLKDIGIDRSEIERAVRCGRERER